MANVGSFLFQKLHGYLRHNLERYTPYFTLSKHTVI